jgi:hypothetical protein
VRRKRRLRDDPSRGVGLAGFADVVVVISASRIDSGRGTARGQPGNPIYPHLYSSMTRFCGLRH